MEKISKLYQKVILQHNESPVNFEKHESADFVVEAYNPLCGDQFKIYLDMGGEKIARAAFFGFGCAISKASTSVLVSRLEGLSLAEVGQLCEQFFTYVTPEKSPEKPHDADFQAFEAAKQFPGRLKCAALSWEEIKNFVQDKKH